MKAVSARTDTATSAGAATAAHNTRPHAPSTPGYSSGIRTQGPSSSSSRRLVFLREKEEEYGIDGRRWLGRGAEERS